MTGANGTQVGVETSLENLPVESEAIQRPAEVGQPLPGVFWRLSALKLPHASLGLKGQDVVLCILLALCF